MVYTQPAFQMTLAVVTFLLLFVRNTPGLKCLTKNCSSNSKIRIVAVSEFIHSFIQVH